MHEIDEYIFHTHPFCHKRYLPEDTVGIACFRSIQAASEAAVDYRELQRRENRSVGLCLVVDQIQLPRLSYDPSDVALFELIPDTIHVYSDLLSMYLFLAYIYVYSSLL